MPSNLDHPDIQASIDAQRVIASSALLDKLCKPLDCPLE
jgi:hypothetical protein